MMNNQILTNVLLFLVQLLRRNKLFMMNYEFSRYGVTERIYFSMLGNQSEEKIIKQYMLT